MHTKYKVEIRVRINDWDTDNQCVSGSANKCFKGGGEPTLSNNVESSAHKSSPTTQIRGADFLRCYSRRSGLRGY